MLAAAGHRSGRDPDAHALVALVLPGATWTRGVWRRSSGVELHRRGQRLVAGVDGYRAPRDRRVDPREAEELFDLTDDINLVTDAHGRRPAVEDEHTVRGVDIVVAARGRSLDEEAAGADCGDHVVVRRDCHAGPGTGQPAALDLVDLMDLSLPKHRRRAGRRHRETGHQVPHQASEAVKPPFHASQRQFPLRFWRISRALG